jgi:phage-related protein
MKPLKFVGSSLEDLQDFPVAARRAAGFELWAVQRGLLPSDREAIASVGAGAYEIRIHIFVFGKWRIIYVAKFEKPSIVLHAFQKKTQKTRRADIAIAARRFKQIEGEV